MSRSDAEHAFIEACGLANWDEAVQYTKSKNVSQQTLRNGLFCAVRKSQPEITRHLLEQGIQLDRAITSIAGKAPNRRMELFQAFHHRGWDVNEPTLFGQSVLSLVVDDIDLVRWFLDQGADPNLGAARYPSGAMAGSVSDSGQTLNLVAINGTVDVLNLMLERGIRLDCGHPLHFATRRSSVTDAEGIPMIERLLEVGVDINGIDDTNYGAEMSDTPLHCALQHGHVKRFQYLLSRGAELDLNKLDIFRRVAEPFAEMREALEREVQLRTAPSERS